MSQRKIAVITGTRATYGYNRGVMQLIKKSAELELAVIVTGMHLLPEFGLTVREVERDNVPIVARVDMMIGGDTPAAWSKSLGVCIQNLTQVYEMIRPEIVLVSGDRGEMLAATVAAVYMNIPVAHIQSGDLSGHIDGSARHAITKLCHIHFPSCEDSAHRVEKLGEEPWRIFDVGAPQLDELIHGDKLSKDELANLLNLDGDEPILVVLQHPVLAEVDKAYDQIVETMEAIKDVGSQTLVIYPNNDAAGQRIIDGIREYEELPFVSSIPNLERKAFMSLIANASLIIGNSSSGILEAPSFKLAAVNIGNRQRGRLQASNVINAPYDRKEIADAIQHALVSEEFHGQLEECVNPYGDGHSSERIVKILGEIEIGERLLDKQMTY